MPKISYLKQKPQRIFPSDWQLFEQEQGCTFVSVPSLCMQMDKVPPPLPPRASAPAEPPKAKPTPVAAPEPPPPPKPAAAVALIEWMIARADKKQAPAQGEASKLSKQPKLPPPFDLYDMPAAQRAAGFPVAAKLAQRWLDGEAYTAYGTDTPGNAQEVRIYPTDKVDLSTVSLGWLRGYPKIEKRYQALLGNLKTQNALIELNKRFRKYVGTQSPHSHELSTKAHSQGDWQRVHRDFQFQLEPVGMGDTLTNTLGLTDVTAALANFAFYAAVASARIHTAVYNIYNTSSGTQHCQKSKVEVTHVWVYAKDSYSFHDAGESSQYLGHWNKQGVIVLPTAVVASVGMKKVADAASAVKDKPKDAWDRQLLEHANTQRLELGSEFEVSRFALDTGGSLLEKDVYYPVRNRDYREWRAKHQRGGDFLIITEPKLVKLDQPIVLDIPEVCS